MKHFYIFYFILIFKSGLSQEMFCVNDKHDLDNITDKISLVIDSYSKKAEISNTIINIELKKLVDDSMRFVVTQYSGYTGFLVKRPSCYFLKKDYIVCLYYQDEVDHNDTTWLKQLVAKSKVVLKNTNTRILSWERRSYTISEPVVIQYDPPILEYIIKNGQIVKIKNRREPLFEDAYLWEYKECK